MEILNSVELIIKEIEIKEAWFKVKKINPFGIMLKSIKSKPNK